MFTKRSFFPSTGLGTLGKVKTIHLGLYQKSGILNGKEGKAAALAKFSGTLTLSQPGRADYAHPLELSCLKNSRITVVIR